MLSQEKIEIIKNYFSEYGPEKIGIFGSYARNEETPQSDLDIYVELKKKFGLFELVTFYEDLEKQLGVKVDILTKGALRNDRLKSYIFKDMKYILG